MTYEEFNLELKRLKLSKNDFSALTGLAYSSIMNWTKNTQPPKWVKSWLENYEKAKKFDEIKKLTN